MHPPWRHWYNDQIPPYTQPQDRRKAREEREAERQYMLEFGPGFSPALEHVNEEVVAKIDDMIKENIDNISPAKEEEKMEK